MLHNRRHVRQLIREELGRALRESEYDDDADEGMFGDSYDGSGYEQLSDMTGTVQWVDGPVDKTWVNSRMSNYMQKFPPHVLPMLASDFQAMLEGEPIDPSIVEKYTHADGTSNVTRQTVEALVDALTRG